MSQFLEVIEWLDESGTEIVHRVPEGGSGETKLGAQLIVRDSQAAIFFKSGRGLDVFGPGRHTLSTMNLPILTKVLALPWGFTSPFRAEVYFVNQKVFTNLRWGTKEPVAFRDRELGLVRLRAFGAFTMKIVEPLLFVNSLVGTQGVFTTADVEDYLRAVIVSRFNDYLGENVDTLVELPQRYDEMAAAVRERLEADFGQYGIALRDFLIGSITPPENVQRRLDERTGMAAVGNLDDYLKFRAANALGNGGAGGNGNGGAPGNGNGAGGAMEMGLGAGLGMILPGMVLRSLRGEPITSPEMLQQGLHCPECHAAVSAESRFCARCGHQMVVARKCPRCAKNVTALANFCPSCGLDLASRLACTSCATPLPPGTRYCFECGEKVPEAATQPPPAAPAP
ncbi:MAG: SPFH domain-containing protein [Deltaproteobacteria bacterium]|nr:SPFH domain-containing protein [Deltaproteobacteria bacterium]